MQKLFPQHFEKYENNSDNGKYLVKVDNTGTCQHYGQAITKADESQC